MHIEPTTTRLMACTATKPLPLSAATFKMNNLFSIFCPTKEIAFHRSSDVVVVARRQQNENVHGPMVCATSILVMGCVMGQFLLGNGVSLIQNEQTS